ncbi:hypothetical protein ABEW34_07660 [Paenibacillus algorifonticola]|uniref:hypothetical protein n=1 Tax=Paenibacillus algorifonticola TaxID=684063 RepID=UPI003D27767D
MHYEQLDEPIATFLKTKERNMREIVGKAYTELGRELKEAQEALSKHGNGCFEKWCESIGFQPRQSRRLIDRYELIRTNCPQRELLEDLPVSLSYEIAAPSAEATVPKRQAKAAVLAGDITTLKEYREMVAKLEAADQQRAALADEKEVLRDTVESLAAAPPRIVADAGMAERLKRYEAQFGDID